MKKGPLRDAFKGYLDRIGRYVTVEAVEVKKGPSGRDTPVSRTLEVEAERLGRAARNADLKVALAVDGRAMDSGALADFIEGAMKGGVKNLAFITGGPFGLSEGLTEECDMKLSLSPMTLPHEMAALVLAEQVYRAFTIIRGEPYSH